MLRTVAFLLTLAVVVSGGRNAGYLTSDKMRRIFCAHCRELPKDMFEDWYMVGRANGETKLFKSKLYFSTFN